MSLPAPSLLVGAQWGDLLSDHAIRFVECRLGHDTPPPGCVCLAEHIFLADAISGVVIEAVPPKVRRTLLAKKPLDRCRLYHVPCKPEQAAAIWSHANAAVGDWYDLAGLLVSLGYVLTGRQDKWYGSQHASVFCSELVCSLLSSYYRSLQSPPAWDYTPSRFELKIASMFHRTEWVPA